MPYELVREAEDLIPIIKRYIEILKEYEETGKEENGGKVIDTFSSFTYWYYFDNIKDIKGLNYIFIPNKFLGYKNHAYEPYKPTQGCGANGTRAREALEPFFECIKDENGDVLAKFKKFVEKFNQNKRDEKFNQNKRDVTIFEPNDTLRELIKKENFIEKNNKTTKTILINGKKNTEQNKSKQQENESSLEIAQECEKSVIKINKIETIFNKDTQESWVLIREPVKSEADFFMFINKLCIFVKEDTRDENPNFKPGTRNGPKFIHRFPDNAVRIISFKEDVENIRNYEDHKKNEKNKLEYIKVCKKYLNIEREPLTIEEFKKFQIKILSEFEISLLELLNISLKKQWINII